MNSLSTYDNKEMEKTMIRRLQDMMMKNKMPCQNSFKNKTFKEVFVPEEHLKAIYTFVEQMQKHSSRVALALAMEKVFVELMNHRNVLMSSTEHVTEHIKELKERSSLPHHELFVVIHEPLKGLKKTKDITIRVPTGIFCQDHAVSYSHERKTLSQIDWNVAGLFARTDNVYDYVEYSHHTTSNGINLRTGMCYNVSKDCKTLKLDHDTDILSLVKQKCPKKTERWSSKSALIASISRSRKYNDSGQKKHLMEAARLMMMWEEEDEEEPPREDDALNDAIEEARRQLQRRRRRWNAEHLG